MEQTGKTQVFVDIANGKDFTIECVWCNGRIVGVSDVTTKEPPIKMIQPYVPSKIDRIRDDYYRRFLAGEFTGIRPLISQKELDR